MRKIWLSLSLVVLAGVFGCTKKTDTAVGSGETSAPLQNQTAVASDDKEIRVGIVASLTGSEATFGTSSRDGALLAQRKINEAGGINGKQLKFFVMDDQGKPEEAANAVTKLITENKVHIIVGEFASSISLAIAPIAQSYKVPMLSPGSTNPKVTQVGDYIFRNCFIDPFQGTVMAKFAFDTLKVKKVAILRDIKNDYSVGLADFFTQTFTKLGGEIVVDESYSAGDIDFKSQLTTIKNKAPEAVFVPGYYTDVGLIGRQARELGVTVPLMGGDGWDSTKLLEIAGDSLNGSYFSNHYSPDDQNPLNQEFVKDYQAAYGKIPDSQAMLGHDAILVLADAFKRAGSTNGADVRNALASVKDLAAAGGSITINEFRDAVKPAVVIKIDGGKTVFQQKVEP